MWAYMPTCLCACVHEHVCVCVCVRVLARVCVNVPKALLPSGNGRDVIPVETGRRVGPRRTDLSMHVFIITVTVI